MLHRSKGTVCPLLCWSSNGSGRRREGAIHYLPVALANRELCSTFNIIKRDSDNAYDLSRTPKLKNMHRDIFTGGSWRHGNWWWNFRMLLRKSRFQCLVVFLLHTWSTQGNNISSLARIKRGWILLVLRCGVIYRLVRGNTKRGKALMVCYKTVEHTRSRGCVCCVQLKFWCCIPRSQT